MAAFADLTLPDRVPTNRIFAARLNDGRMQMWRFGPDSNIINDRTVVTRIYPPSKEDGEYKVHLTVDVPLVDAPAPGVGYTPAPKRIAGTKMQVIFFLPARAPVTDRQDALAYLKGALASTQISDLVTLLSPPRG